MEWWYCIYSAQLSSGGDDVVAFLAIALDLDPAVLVSVLDHYYQTGPPFGQVIGRHTLSPFMPLA